jgi:hypothetical protein
MLLHLHARPARRNQVRPRCTWEPRFDLANLLRFREKSPHRRSRNGYDPQLWFLVRLLLHRDVCYCDSRATRWTVQFRSVGGIGGRQSRLESTRGWPLLATGHRGEGRPRDRGAADLWGPTMATMMFLAVWTRAIDTAPDVLKSPWWRGEMVNFSARKCVETFERYYNAKNHALETEHAPRRLGPPVGETEFLAKMARSTMVHTGWALAVPSPWPSPPRGGPLRSCPLACVTAFAYPSWE